MYKKHKRGFTLIELLVVIAIIGILASIVLVSFPGATKRAKDSRVMSAIAQARTEMTSFNANNGTYVGVKAAIFLTQLDEEIAKNSYGAAALEAFGNAGAACMYAPLNEKDGATWYCADSTGVAGKSGGATPVNPNTTCTAALFTCPAGTSL